MSRHQIAELTWLTSILEAWSVNSNGRYPCLDQRMLLLPGVYGIGEEPFYVKVGENRVSYLVVRSIQGIIDPQPVLCGLKEDDLKAAKLFLQLHHRVNKTLRPFLVIKRSEYNRRSRSIE